MDDIMSELCLSFLEDFREWTFNTLTQRWGIHLTALLDVRSSIQIDRFERSIPKNRSAQPIVIWYVNRVIIERITTTATSGNLPQYAHGSITWAFYWLQEQHEYLHKSTRSTRSRHIGAFPYFGIHPLARGHVHL